MLMSFAANQLKWKEVGGWRLAVWKRERSADGRSTRGCCVLLLVDAGRRNLEVGTVAAAVDVGTGNGHFWPLGSGNDGTSLVTEKGSHHFTLGCAFTSAMDRCLHMCQAVIKL